MTHDDGDRIITMDEIRRAGFCASGSRRWFEQHGMDFRKIVREGITVRDLLATKDGNAQHVVDFVRGQHG
jgi:hypothetical protein